MQNFLGLAYVCLEGQSQKHKLQSSNPPSYSSCGKKNTPEVFLNKLRKHAVFLDISGVEREQGYVPLTVQSNVCNQLVVALQLSLGYSRGLSHRKRWIMHPSFATKSFTSFLLLHKYFISLNSFQNTLELHAWRCCGQFFTHVHFLFPPTTRCIEALLTSITQFQQHCALRESSWILFVHKMHAQIVRSDSCDCHISLQLSCSPYWLFMKHRASRFFFQKFHHWLRIFFTLRI